MGGGGIAAKKEVGEGDITSAWRKAGIYYIWNPIRRVARAKVRALDSGKEIEVYGIYMPVRKNGGGRVEVIWEKVIKDVMDRGTKSFVINGDFNAETESWIKKSGRIQMVDDVVIQGVIEDLNLITSITKDYTFERARTQIDNILTAHTATRVREKDHRLVVARLAWEMKREKGEDRPTRRYTDKFKEEQRLGYKQMLKERIVDIKESLKNMRPKDKLMELQEAVTRAAA
eukprot:6214596-Pleurochrysis_carterae.AAC.3